MKKQTLFLLLSAATLLCVSCSKDTPETSADSINTWKVGDYTFKRTMGTAGSLGNGYAVLVQSSNKTSDGLFIGSMLNISFVNKGEGEYNLSDLKSQLGDGRDMHLTCSLQKGVATMVNYEVELPTTIKATVKKDAKGAYHITISQPLKLVKDKTSVGADDKSPDSFTLIVNNVY